MYIETPLFSLAQTFLRAFSFLPIEPLRLDQNGKLFFEIPPLKYFTEYGSLTNAFCIVIPLICATSVTNIKQKIDIFFLVIIFIILLEATFIMLDIYYWLISNYSFWVFKQKIDLYHLDISPIWRSDLIQSCLAYLHEFHIIFIIGIWAGITYLHKRKNSHDFLEAIL